METDLDSVEAKLTIASALPVKGVFNREMHLAMPA